MTKPTIIRAGDTIKFSEPAFDTYSAPTWTRTVAIRHRTSTAGLNVVGVSDGAGGWNFTITAAQSATFAAGDLYYQDFVTLAAERYTLDEGIIECRASLPAGASTSFDGRSQTEIDLEAVKAAIRAKIAGGDVQEYSIGNRSLKKMAMADLLALESKLKADLVFEGRTKRTAEGKPSGRNVFVRFGGY